MGLSWPLLGKKKAQHPPRQPKLGRKWVLSAFRAASWGALGANLGLSGGSGALLGAILGPSWGHFGAILGPCVAIFGQPKRFVAEKADKQKMSKAWCVFVHFSHLWEAGSGHFGAIWGLLGAILGLSWALLGQKAAPHGPRQPRLGRKSALIVSTSVKHAREVIQKSAKCCKNLGKSA